MDLSQDFRDLLAVFAEHDVQYLLIGGYAVAFHSRPRFTKDIDLWLGNDTANLQRAVLALATFGAPQQTTDGLLSCADDEIIWFGIPPARVDLLKQIPGVDFRNAYAHRVSTEWDGVRVDIIGRDDLIQAKKAAGREQDLKDAILLQEETSRDAQPASAPEDPNVIGD